MIHSLPWITIFGSLVMRFANNFHSWLRHSWKLLANRLTCDPKIVIHGNSCIILYISHVKPRCPVGGGGGCGSVLGWVLVRDAQHHHLTENATMGIKGGGRNYTFCQKIGVEIQHFPHFSSNIGGGGGGGGEWEICPETWKRGVEMVEHM